MATYGGSKFSGKEPSKDDRSAAYAARFEAKNNLSDGLASKCQIQVAHHNGVAHPKAAILSSEITPVPSVLTVVFMVNEHFDLRPHLKQDCSVRSLWP